jgi:hypothetical protein
MNPAEIAVHEVESNRVVTNLNLMGSLRMRLLFLL